MQTDEIPTRCAEVQTLLAERLHIRAPSLASSLDKSRRLLPRNLRRHARTLAQAELLSQHPKLRRTLDLRTIEAAQTALTTHLRAIDPAARRRARVLNFLAFVALVVLAVGAGFIVWLRWRGLV